MNIDDVLCKNAESVFRNINAFDKALASHGGSRSEFSDGFAKEVAKRYLSGLVDFYIADCAINALSIWAPLENSSACTRAIYKAFDEGEYLHQGQEIGTSEVLYTRPLLRKVMFEFFPNEFR
jgi:hypothetical protein